MSGERNSRETPRFSRSSTRLARTSESASRSLSAQSTGTYGAKSTGPWLPSAIRRGATVRESQAPSSRTPARSLATRRVLPSSASVCGSPSKNSHWLRSALGTMAAICTSR